MDVNNIKTNEVFLWKKFDYDEIIISIKLSVLNHVLHIGQFEDYQITFFDVENLSIEENIYDLDYCIPIGSFHLESILIDPGAELHDKVLKTWINKTKDFSFFEKSSDPFIINNLLIFVKNNKYCVLNDKKQFEKIDLLLTNFGIKEIKNLKMDLSAKEVIEYIENE